MQQAQQQPALASGTQTNARLCLLGDLGNSSLVLQSYTHSRASSSKGAVFTHPCSTWGVYQLRHRPLALSSARDKSAHHQLWPGLPLPSTSPPLAWQSSPDSRKTLQTKPVLPSCSHRDALLHAHPPFFPSFKALRFSFCLTHPFMLHFLPLPPDPCALRWIQIASPAQCRQPVPLPLTDTLPQTC